MVKSVCRVGANTGTNHVSYCRKDLSSRVFANAQHGGNIPVPLRASTGNEIVGDLGVADAYLNAALGTEMVGAPRLITLAFAANPTSHQISIVEVQVVVDDLPVDELAAVAGLARRIGVNRLGAEVEFGEAREVGQIDSGIERGTLRAR